MWKKSILLRPVETVYLVNKKHCTLSGTPSCGSLINDPSNITDPSGNSAEPYKMLFHKTCHN
jgi:hypothetical protein